MVVVSGRIDFVFCIPPWLCGSHDFERVLITDHGVLNCRFNERRCGLNRIQVGRIVKG